MSPGWRRAIILTNTGMLLIWHLGLYLSEISYIYNNSISFPHVLVPYFIQEMIWFLEKEKIQNRQLCEFVKTI